MCQTAKNDYVLMKSNLIMPYSYLSYITHFAQKDLSTKMNEYVEASDYYKIEGGTLLHRHIDCPVALEAIIDSYWLQMRDLTTSVLQKTEKRKMLANGLLEIESGINAIESMITVKYEKIINKMLFYLSQIDIQKSFTLMYPLFAECMEYNFFPAYMDTWFTQTV